MDRGLGGRLVRRVGRGAIGVGVDALRSRIRRLGEVVLGYGRDVVENCVGRIVSRVLGGLVGGLLGERVGRLVTGLLDGLHRGLGRRCDLGLHCGHGVGRGDRLRSLGQGCRRSSRWLAAQGPDGLHDLFTGGTRPSFSPTSSRARLR